MGEDPGTARAALANDKTGATEKDPEQLRAEIEDTRRELGDTVEALVAKTDVKARVRDRIQSTRALAADRIQSTRGLAADRFQSTRGSAAHAAQNNQVPLAVAGLVAAGLLAWLLFKR